MKEKKTNGRDGAQKEWLQRLKHPILVLGHMCKHMSSTFQTCNFGFQTLLCVFSMKFKVWFCVHFILMAIEVHNTLEQNMDCFIMECARLFHDPCLFAFIFLGNVLVLLFSVLQFLIQRENLCWQVTFVLNLPLLLDLIICMQVTLKGPWAKLLPTMKGTSSFSFYQFLRVVLFLAFFWPFFGLPFLSPL